MTDRTLSARALNRALLARQLLLERSRTPLTDALEQVGGLQTQYAPAGYVGLWSRVAEIRREDLDEALGDRRVAQATLMRSTIHMVSAADYWAFAAGTRPSRMEWWRRVARGPLADIDMDAAAGLVRERLAGEPARQADLVQHLEAHGFPRAAWSAIGQWLDLVRVPPSGTWGRRRADLFGLADEWLGPPDVDEMDGLVHLLRRYLGGFGPASLADASSWAGVPATKLRAAAAELELRRFRDERGRELLDLPDAPLPPPDTPAPVRFLPVWEASLLVHARRSLVLPEEYRPLVFNTKTPHSVNTFLVDGTVAGTWRYEDERVTLAPFAPLDPAVRDRLEEEADRLAAFHHG
jgi:hypothetical protein